MNYPKQAFKSLIEESRKKRDQQAIINQNNDLDIDSPYEEPIQEIETPITKKERQEQIKIGEIFLQRGILRPICIILLP